MASAKSYKDKFICTEHGLWSIELTTSKRNSSRYYSTENQHTQTVKSRGQGIS